MPAEFSGPPATSGILIPILDVGVGQGKLLRVEGITTSISIKGWTPDGCFLVVGRYLVNVVTGASKPLLSENDLGKVLFSSDGEWLAYESADKAQPGWPQWIFAVRVSGDEPIMLSTGWTGLIGWMNGGHKVLYWIQKEGRPEQGVREIYAVDMDSMAQCMVARIPEPLKRWEDLYLADVISCQPIPLALSGSLEKADWVLVRPAPGHGHVALFLGESGGGDFGFAPSLFLIVNTRSGEAAVVFKGGFWMSNFWAWSPDGTRLVLVGELPEGEGAYLVEVTTAEWRKLSIEATVDSPSWSPDGRLLAFQSYDTAPLLYDLETGSIAYLPPEFGYRRGLQGIPFLWSPRLFYGSEACR